METEKKGTGKKFLPALRFIPPPLFFISQNVKVSVVQENACRVVHGFMSVASIRSAALSCASLRPTAANGCTSEYFNCANSSCCSVSELVMCIKPSARTLFVIGRDLFSSFSVAPFVIVSTYFLSWRNWGWEEECLFFCAVCSTQFYLLFIFFRCFVLLLLFKIIFH